MNIAIIGSGYVGLVTGACFAEVGHRVICVDNNQAKVESLLQGRIPIYEPGLEDVIHNNVSAHRLDFTTDLRSAIEKSQVIFIAVPTPPLPDGSVDLSFVEGVASEIGEVLNGMEQLPTWAHSYRVIVDKSTVPVKTAEKVAAIIGSHTQSEFAVVSNPEFLREGSAIADLMHPDRIVIGSNDDRALALMKKIYEPFMAPIMVTDVNSAELIKHAANSFLSLKISFINAIAAICEASGADVEMVADGMGADKRIGRSFLNAGLGYGGSCFPKDTTAFIAIAEELGEPFNLMKEVVRINAHQRVRFIQKVERVLGNVRGKTIGVWGLAFKPNTDDIRESVAIKIVEELVEKGAYVQVHDFEGTENFLRSKLAKSVHVVKDPISAAYQADALILATEWTQYHHVNLDAVRVAMNPDSRVIFDGRNFFDPEMMREVGFTYYGIGR